MLADGSGSRVVRGGGSEIKVETQAARKSELEVLKREFRDAKEACATGFVSCSDADEKWSAVVRLTNLINGVE